MAIVISEGARAAYPPRWKVELGSSTVPPPPKETAFWQLFFIQYLLFVSHCSKDLVSFNSFNPDNAIT